MDIEIKTIKRLILCIKQISDSEIKEYYNIFQDINYNFLLQYISKLKLELLILRMYLLNLNINSLLKKFNLKHPLNYLKKEYENCDFLELEYIINFYNFLIQNIDKISVLKLLTEIQKINKIKYLDILLLRKAKNNFILLEEDYNRLVYLNNIFNESKISYIIKEKEYTKIFKKKPKTEEEYQEIDESTNDKYLIWKDYKNVLR